MLVATGLVVVALGIVAALIPAGVIWPNRIFAAKYDVRGVDVSHHQGEIDWELLAGEDVDFAYIKATEGSSHVDERFEENWAGAREAGLVVGAYHFMSFDSPGASQAANVIASVPTEAGTLPPVVDVEGYGRYVENLPDARIARPILDDLLAGLEEHYGVPAIIYTTGEAYDVYIRDAYPDNPIWIRSVALPPDLPDDRDWTFWQYSNRDRLDGVGAGAEPFVDMNVFVGGRRDFDELLLD